MSPSDLTPVDLPGGGQRTRSIGHLMAALARAQQRMKNPGKDARNPHLSTRYASMAETRDCTIPVLAAEGIGVSQWVSLAGQELVCWTMLGHCSGEYQLTPLSVPCPQETGRGVTAIQARGSAISYAKRYGLQAVAMVVGDVEDDGERAGSTTPLRSSGTGKPVPDLTQGQSGSPGTMGREPRGWEVFEGGDAPARKSASALRHEIDALARQQGRILDSLWGAAKQRFGKSREELTVEQLEQMLKGLQDRGTA